MPRREFSRKVRAQAFLRCNGVCEGCGARLKTGEAEYDHILPCEFDGEATVDNCQVLCRVCHKQKTANDVRALRKSDRIRDKNTSAWKRKSKPIPGSKASGLRKRMNGQVERRDA